MSRERQKAARCMPVSPGPASCPVPGSLRRMGTGPAEAHSRSVCGDGAAGVPSPRPAADSVRRASPHHSLIAGRSMPDSSSSAARWLVSCGEQIRSRLAAEPVSGSTGSRCPMAG